MTGLQPFPLRLDKNTPLTIVMKADEPSTSGYSCMQRNRATAFWSNVFVPSFD